LQIVKQYLPEDDDDALPIANSNGVHSSDVADSVSSSKKSSQKTPRSKRKPAVVAVAPVAEHNGAAAEVDTAHHVIRICGVDNAKLLHDRGISQLSQLRGSPVAVLRDIVGDDAPDVDLWPQMAALLADGHVWFDVERLRASRHARARSPPTRLAPHRSSQDEPASPLSSQPVTPKAPASARGKRANPARAANGDSVRSSAKRSHAAAAAALATPPVTRASTRASTRSASKK